MLIHSVVPAIPTDPLERLRQHQPKEIHTIDVDDAVEKMKIGETNPENYLDALRKTIADNSGKVYTNFI